MVFVPSFLVLLSVAASVSSEAPWIRRAATGSPILCQMVHAHEQGASGHREFLTCDLIAEQEGVVAFGLSIELPDDIVSEHEEALNRGEWFVNITGATIEEKEIQGYGMIRTGVTLTSDSTINTVTPEDGKMAMLSATGVRRESESPANRQLQTTGTHTVLVLRVSVSDSSPTFSASDLANDFFDNSFSVATQYSGCSFGAVQFQSYDSSNPVVDVLIQGSAASFTSSTLWPLAMSAGASQKGVSYLTNLAQHVAIILPPNLSDSSSWYAIGSVGGWWSLFNDKWGGYPNFGVHELGHNLGMGHSGVGSDQYADMSDVMGYGDTQQFGVSKCFNGYHFWYLNWFASRSISVDPYTHNVLTLAAFAQFDRTSGTQYVVINVDNYYLVYNRAIGINSGVDDVPDTVTVAQSAPNVFSLRVAALDNSGVFQVANYGGGSQPLIVKVCSISTGGALDYAVVSIGVGVSDCTGGVAFTQSTSAPSGSVSNPSPVVPPTSAPVLLPPTLKPTKPPTKVPVASPTPAPVSPTPKPVVPTHAPVPPLSTTVKPTLRHRHMPTLSPALREGVALPTRAPRTRSPRFRPTA